MDPGPTARRLRDSLENLAQWLEDDGIGVLVCPGPSPVS